MQCLVLAGGLATRMRPLTETIPKSLIPILGKPFIDYQLDWLAQGGVTNVVLSIGFLGDQIEEHVGDGSLWGLEVRYVNEGPELRGTGGAVRLALDQGVLQDRFLTVYGDSYLPIEVRPVWDSFVASGKPALMTVFRNEGRWDRSNVDFTGGVLRRYDKEAGGAPEFKYLDYGMLGLTSAVVAERIPANQKIDLAGPLKQLSLEGLLVGFEVTNRFYEIGSPQGVEDFSSYLKEQRV